MVQRLSIFHKAKNSHRDVLIGTPFPNYQVYIVDPNFQPVLIGVKGEILIAGTGVARGYLNQSELTKEKFIPNLFSDEPGSRLYRTGDVGRYLPIGNIEFLGRSDSQVKIRGFRVELGEIESVLEQHPSIQNAVVLTREDQFGDKRLVAYCSPKEKSILTIEAIKSHISKRLPVYMVPSMIIVLDALPMTASHKVDRSCPIHINNDPN